MFGGALAQTKVDFGIMPTEAAAIRAASVPAASNEPLFAARRTRQWPQHREAATVFMRVAGLRESCCYIATQVGVELREGLHPSSVGRARYG